MATNLAGSIGGTSQPRAPVGPVISAYEATDRRLANAPLTGSRIGVGCVKGRRSMPEAVFVCGGTGGGKTTVARALAGRHGLRLLQIDHFWYAHSERAGETPPAPDVQWLGF